MFDFVRKHTKVMMSLMFLLIIPAFVLVGVDGFSKINGGGAAVASVAGTSISQAEWDHFHKVEVDRLRESMPTIDVKLLESPEARYSTLERMVREHVLVQASQDSFLTTTDARLARELQQNPTIASFRKPDGALDMERYKQFAASQGLSTDGFEARVRSDLSVRQVEAGVMQTAFAPKALSNVVFNAFFEKREVQIAKFASGDYAAKVALSDADIEAFYQSNQSLFQVPDSANIEYVVLDLDAVKKVISLNEADVKTYYEQNVSRFSGQEQRRASHILINAPKGMAAAERDKAKALATTLAAQARKVPQSFAELAKKNSQDPGSAPLGGDLEFFGRGAMVKPFEDAAFAMKKGEVSEVVESDFGYHIIQLTDIKAPKQRSFEELRTGLEAELKAQQATKKYAELADVFINGVYEQSDALKPIAERLKLEVQTASGLHRVAAPGATGVLANPKILAAIFSADSIDKKRNTDAIEVAANQLVAARVTQYNAAKVLPLAEVRNNVRDRLLQSRGAELAKKDGADKLAAWKSNSANANLSAATVVSRERGQTLQGPLMDAAMQADTSSLPAWVGVDMGSQGYAVVRINKLIARTVVADEVAQQERAQYAKWVANAESAAYYEELKDRFKVKFNVKPPARALSEGNSATQ
jgi:peptidyl-prolyl cis-trans isomerase D